ncbi:MAG TPA: UDP-N-acetylmuramoyl-L-alanine--D-glutamate ligase [Aminivibrio sp.]|jgi:UDP-N-acetylmuramoylalanine--D-glutamate ligase|nr:UDP-N-acetylmuramoyl-L-alanine--D-glutamate ligase [Aminivibrio sp.]MDD3514119.1 UDP-N-acetylmuramoyl-L-alanine--D-glutamate ligase [Synergistaceae bacterium]MEA4951202.1 UDP-N-acetylmuramoyl-L-alanine--D-glutamate ligase [Aminivibrio sp.]NCB15991.1 UDP-N-acetylmuramoyl-L-alanine--D-glutamate ligase [Synergistales bacterium]HRX25264.1 UDP-N-acetylmuramoyl-L-alanine--D-glutamate ligase [Aminivibrio sp.]
MEPGNNLQGKKITIIGSGVSGKGLASFAAGLGASVFVTERKHLDEEARAMFRKKGIAWEEDGHSVRACDADMVVAGSGIPPAAPVVIEARKRGIPVTGELDFLAPFLRGKVLGVTGSNGKSTTTALLGHMLTRKGFAVSVAGNIGTSLADSALRNWDYIVVELSSFQLHWNYRLSCSVAVVTNLAPDHIDWHGSYEEYIRAKARIISTQRECGIAVVQERDRTVLGSDLADDRFVCFSWKEDFSGRCKKAILADERTRSVYFRTGNDDEKLFGFDDLPLIGRHNIENASMAAGVLRLLGEKDIPGLFTGFCGLPHRCEIVADIGGVLFIDDSKGTNVASTCTALTSIEGPKAIILGGQGKGEDYAPLAETVRKEALAAVVMGEEREKIVSALKKAGYGAIIEAEGMEDAVKKAASALPGKGVVLLSPACTSWDMYPNYKKRGEHFKSIVLSLEGSS